MKETPFFTDYVKKYTDLPFLIKLDKTVDGNLRAGKFLRAKDLGMKIGNADWKTVVFDKNSGKFAVPNGTIGHRWEDNQTWNLHLTDTDNHLEDIDPLLTFAEEHDDVMKVNFPEFLTEGKNIMTRHVPIKKIKVNAEDHYVTTVFDLMVANCGVSRGLKGEKDIHEDDAETAYTPAWQEKLTGVPAKEVAQIAREFAQNAIDSKVAR